MKRIGGLFDRIADARTLTEAAWRAARGKRGRPEVAAFLSRLDAHTATMVRELHAGEYRFGAYRTFAIRDPKTRLIHAPPFRDRVLHHAIVAVCGPGFERGAIAHSYACRAGRGQHAALRQAQAWMRRADWFLKLDVAKYYDSLPHAALRERLARRFREGRLLALFDHLLESHHHAPGRGLPIGALTSQYLGNFFLDAFDHWVLAEARVPRYLRYMDDMLLLASHTALRRLLPAAHATLGALGLGAKSAILNRCTLGVPWLGFTLYPGRSRLNRAGRRRLRGKLGTVERAWARGAIGSAELQARAGSLFAHACCADDVAWRRMVLTFSRTGEAPEPAARPARRLVEQHGGELPLRDPQQEQGRQQEQEHRFPAGAGSRHGGARPPDDAPSRARCQRDEATGKTPAELDIHAPPRVEKRPAGAPPEEPAP